MNKQKIVKKQKTRKPCDHEVTRFNKCIRCGEQVGPERATELWRAFVSGHGLLLAHDFRDGQRRILTGCESSKVDTGPLTARERHAALLVAQGQSFKEVAFELRVAVSTAWTLVASAVRKLGLR